MAAIASLSFTSCYIRISKEGKEELRNKLEIREFMREVVYSVDDPQVYAPGSFDALDCSGGMDVTFIQRDGEPQVLVFGTHRSRDSVVVENKDGRLRIYYGNKLGFAYTFDESVTIYSPGVEEITNNGSGDLLLKGTYSGSSLTVKSNGSGDVKIEDCSLSGPLSISNRGSGDVEMKVDAGETTITNNGSGDISAKGKTGNTTIRNYGSGDIDVSRLEATSMDVQSKGSGEVKSR